MSNVQMKVRLTPTAAGKLYQKYLRLESANKELLEALKQAVESMQDSGYPNNSVAVMAARAAIDKAEGRQ